MKIIKFFILILILTVSINVAYASNLTVESQNQTYEEDKKLITLDKEVNVTIDDIKVMSPKAFLTINAQGKPDTATFVDGAKAIQVTKNSTSETKANILKLSLIKKEVEATGDVVSTMQKLGKPTVTIKSDYQSYNTNSNIMNVKDNVILTYGDVKATANSAKIWISKQNGFELLKLIGNAKVTQEQITVTGSEVDLDARTEIMTANGNAFTNIVNDNTNIRIWAAHQEYNNKSNTAIASGSVKIKYDTYVATGPKAVMIADPKTQKPDKIIFSGRSKIVDGAKSIEADKIVITAMPKSFKADGNVKTEIKDLSNLE